MTSALDLVLQAPHEAKIRSLLAQGTGAEAAGYLLFGIADIVSDPWSNAPRRRLISHDFREIAAVEKVSSSDRHVTWKTDGFMRLLGEAAAQKLVPAIVHTHPKGVAAFSKQDDYNEAELARTASLKGVDGLVSIVIAGNGAIAARLWRSQSDVTDGLRVLHTGPRLALSGIDVDTPDIADFLDRQIRLFGEQSNSIIRSFRCGVAGGGATGSATLPLLMRLGVKEAVLFDKDRVDLSNLNRLHGARREDVEAKLRKTEMHARTVEEAGLSMNLISIDAWAGEPRTHDALKACDVIFCCTDDHAGRLFLNRFARFYGIPVIDMGLAMQRRPDGEFDLFARVSTLVAGHPCLICGGHVSPRRAREESLRRNDLEEYERLKAEAYVLGEGDPSPAVVTFTTEAACMAVNEWLAGITGFHGSDGMAATRIRRFHACDDRFLATAPTPECPACGKHSTMGRGDVEPFLDMVI